MGEATTSTRWTDGMRRPRRRGLAFDAVPRPLFLVFGLLGLWLVLAALAFALMPSGNPFERDATALIGQYICHSLRNGLPSVTVICGIGMVIALRRGEDVFVPTVLAHQVIYAVIGFVVFTLMIFAYSTLKVRIPALVPFQWDAAFMRLDRALFLGRDPWTLGVDLYGVPKLMAAMDTVYSLWAGLLAGGFIACFALAGGGHTGALRLPVALMLAWLIGGNVLAVAFSSAGPCYYGAVVGGVDPYAAQMAALRALPASALGSTLDYQTALWAVHEGRGFGLGGISAMPSMHCTTSLVFTCAVWHRPYLRWAALAFAMLIWISSVMLAWHYAVDGLLALPIAVGAWWAAGRFISPRRKAQS